MKQADDKETSMRLDKWLWAARFYTTRALATAAINGGKVHVSGERCKPSRRINPGATLTVQKGSYRFTITVAGLASRRGPAEEARALYMESAASAAARHALSAERRLQGHAAGAMPRWPDKRTRRLIHKFKHRT